MQQLSQQMSTLLVGEQERGVRRPCSWSSAPFSQGSSGNSGHCRSGQTKHVAMRQVNRMVILAEDTGVISSKHRNLIPKFGGRAENWSFGVVGEEIIQLATYMDARGVRHHHPRRQRNHLPTGSHRPRFLYDGYHQRAGGPFNVLLTHATDQAVRERPDLKRRIAQWCLARNASVV